MSRNQQKSDIFMLEKQEEVKPSKVKDYQKSTIFQQPNQEQIQADQQTIKVLDQKIPLVTSNKSNLFQQIQEEEPQGKVRKNDTTQSQLFGQDENQKNLELFQHKKQKPPTQQKTERPSSKNCKNRPQDTPSSHIFGEYQEPPVKKDKVNTFEPKYQIVDSPAKQLQSSLHGEAAQNWESPSKNSPDKSNINTIENVYNAQWWTSGGILNKAQVNENAVFDKDYHRKKNIQSNISSYFQQDILQKNSELLAQSQVSSQRPQTAASQVNENAVFDQNYHQSKKQQENQSTYFENTNIQENNSAFKKKKQEDKQFQDQQWNERKNDRNYSNLFGYERPQKTQPSQQQQQSQENQQKPLLPSTLGYLQHDSNKFGDHQENQEEQNCAQKHFNNLRSVLDQHTYQAEYLRGVPINKKISTAGKDVQEKFVNGQVVEVSTEEAAQQKKKYETKETEQIPETRVALFRQKEQQLKQNIQIYEIEVRGVSDKLDSQFLKKFVQTKGYNLLDFKIDLNKNTKKPTGRGLIILRNSRKNPDGIDSVKAFIQSQGLQVATCQEKEVDSKQLQTKKEEPNQLLKVQVLDAKKEESQKPKRPQTADPKKAKNAQPETTPSTKQPTKMRTIYKSIKK